jgi:hypothetical protein
MCQIVEIQLANLCETRVEEHCKSVGLTERQNDN